MAGGLVHVSEIADRVEWPETALELGQAVRVRTTEIDERRARIRLSIRQAVVG